MTSKKSLILLVFRPPFFSHRTPLFAMGEAWTLIGGEYQKSFDISVFETRGYDLIEGKSKVYNVRAALQAYSLRNNSSVGL